MKFGKKQKELIVGSVNVKFYGGKHAGGMAERTMNKFRELINSRNYKPHKISPTIPAEALVMWYSGALHNPHLTYRKRWIKEILDAMDIKGRELSEESISGK